MHLLTRIVNNSGRYCLMSVLSLYFYFWYIIEDFTKKNEFFLPKSDRLIYLLISIFAEEIDDEAEKKEFYISSGACSLNLFMKFAYKNMKNYIPGMDSNRTLI